MLGLVAQRKISDNSVFDTGYATKSTSIQYLKTGICNEDYFDTLQRG